MPPTVKKGLGGKPLTLKKGPGEIFTDIEGPESVCVCVNTQTG